MGAGGAYGARLARLEQQVARLNAQAGGGEQLSPNPPILPAIQSNAAAVAAVLAPFFDAAGAGQAAVDNYNTQRAPARWHRSTSYTPAGGVAVFTPVIMDTVDDDALGCLTNTANGWVYNIPTTGRYLCAVHIRVNNGTTSPALIAGAVAANGSIVAEDTQTVTAVAGDRDTSCTAVDLRDLAAGQVVQPYFFANPIVPLIVGSGTDTWMFVVRIS